VSSILRDLFKRTTLANVVAAIVIVVSVAYAVHIGDSELLKNIALIAVGYLFGVGVKSVHSGG